MTFRNNTSCCRYTICVCFVFTSVLRRVFRIYVFCTREGAAMATGVSLTLSSLAPTGSWIFAVIQDWRACRSVLRRKVPCLLTAALRPSAGPVIRPPPLPPLPPLPLPSGPHPLPPLLPLRLPLRPPPLPHPLRRCSRLYIIGEFTEALSAAQY